MKKVFRIFNLMGCSSSMSVPMSEKQPLEYPQIFQEQMPLKPGGTESVRLSNNDIQNNKNNNKTQNNNCDSPVNVRNLNDPDINLNNAKILIISKDAERDDSADSSAIVPIFENDENNRKTSDTYNNSCLQTMNGHRKSNSGRGTRAMSLPGSIKSVLKAGQRDPHSHILANRPIKTVTFVDSVTVVTVY